MRHLLWAPLLISGVPAAEASSPLWNNVRVGMTVAEVRAAQPKAVEAKQRSTLHGGAACELEISSFEVAHDDYRVCFYFLNKKLIQIMFTSLDTPNEPQFRGIVTALRAKYGTEISNEKTSLGHEVDWLSAEGVNVSITYIDKLLPLLNISYQVRLADDASKL